MKQQKQQAHTKTYPRLASKCPQMPLGATTSLNKSGMDAVPPSGPFWYTSGYASGILQDHGWDGCLNGRGLAGYQHLVANIDKVSPEIH